MKTNLKTESLGLIVPMNIEAVCIDEVSSKKKQFEPEPYDFSFLPKGGKTDKPYLSQEVKTGDSRSLGVGVHLHWALPDGLTRGSSRQDESGNVSFPETPDRWLITRTFSDLSGMVNRTKSWVVESNYLSADQPDPLRPSLAVPFKTDDYTQGKLLYRYLGRVLEYDKWLANQSQNDESGGSYVGGLSAIGYGSPTFSASYNTSKNIFGFYDTDKDLAALGNDITLSYHVVGWYHNDASDPIKQPPLQFNQADFERILAKASEENKNILNSFYKVIQLGGAYILAEKTTTEQHISIIRALSSAGFDHLAYFMNRHKWSLPSGTVKNHEEVTHTLYTGIITNIKWNKEKSAFKELSDQLNIAVGNTASQALAALIAKVSKLPETANVELLLDALQLDRLRGITKPGELNRLEDLAIALHTSSYTSSDGGQIWEVTKVDAKDGKHTLRALSQTLGEDLNELNNLQLQYDKTMDEIESAKSQIFMDWYRFIQVFRKKGEKDPSDGIDLSDLGNFINDQIEALGKKTDSISYNAIIDKSKKIQAMLAKEYQLVRTAASRYWQPTEPVVLFQGKDITPPERYGGDGRFMADGTLLCRLSSQVINSITIPANIVGNSSELTFDAGNTPKLPQNMQLDFAEQLYALFTESSLLNPTVMSLLCKSAGATDGQDAIAGTIEKQRNKYLTPAVPETLSSAAVEEMRSIVSTSDLEFLLSFYLQKDNVYTLLTPEDKIAPDNLKRIRYTLISASKTSGSTIAFTGVAPSMVYFVKWDGNPWLPYSLSWKTTYYPIAGIKPDSKKDVGYAPDFISKNFKLGDAAYEYSGPRISSDVFQVYKNSIFLSPHAEENFQTMIQKFIDAQPGASIDKSLTEILEKLNNFPPILSQSINGFNDATVMRHQVMQLEVKDVGPEDPYQRFTNEVVRPAVGKKIKSAPSPSDFYNPIRAGFMRVDELIIVDVFGCKMFPTSSAYSNMTVAQTLKPKQADQPIYLEPRLSQSARLQFRWLSAANKAKPVETNSHPATTPICGWILANHLQPGLWFYAAEGAPLGALNLTEDRKNVIWQTVPGRGKPGMKLTEFFNSDEGKDVNSELKKLATSLFNNGNGSYLDNFLLANDKTFSTIKPQNYRQTGSNAVLIGSPIAVTQASLGIELQGAPAYSNGWNDLKKEVEQASARRKSKQGAQPIERTDNGFTKVRFPVRLGNTTQTEDGLLGYFTNDNYERYYAIGTHKSTSKKVTDSSDNDIELSIHQSKHETIVTLLLDPRGSVHARTGVLPTKTIDIPPSQFADALENLEVAFLTSPVLYYHDVALNKNKPAMPVPAEGGAEWLWVQRELDAWASAQTQPVDDRAKLSDVPNEIREGWLLLTNFNK